MEGRSVLSSSGEQVREEIQRFESIHPYIYRAYNLIDLIEDETIRNNLEQQMVCIEDAFIRSQEWTLTRNVPVIRLGVIGSLDSGKAPLVHRYLTGGYRVRESKEGGRFKKDLVIEGKSHLLLIRDEGNQEPDQDFTHWLDGALVVYNVTSKESFNVAVSYLKALARFRSPFEFPVTFIGATEGLSTAKRVISEEEARKYASDLNWHYMEVCSTTGLKVEHTFVNICIQILNQQNKRGIYNVNHGSLNRPRPSNRVTNNQPDSVSKTSRRHSRNPDQGLYSHQRSISAAPVYDPRVEQDTLFRMNGHNTVTGARFRNSAIGEYSLLNDAVYNSNYAPNSSKGLDVYTTPLPYTRSVTNYNDNQIKHSFLSPAVASTSQLPTPSSTPSSQRKNYRRISSMFSRKDTDHHVVRENIGHGRPIPLKQGFLYKKGNTGLTSKKKYVCLLENGKLCYFNNYKAFQEQSHHPKEILLALAAVRVKKDKNHLSKRRSSLMSMIKPGKENLGPTLSHSTTANSDRVSIVSEQGIPNPASTPGDVSSGGNLSDFEPPNIIDNPSTSKEAEVKQRKKQRRLGTFGVRPLDDEEDCEFELITSDQRRLEFVATSIEDRDEWVSAIEAEISKALSGSQLTPSRGGRPTAAKSEIDKLLRIPGNDVCVDCGGKNPCWAVINHGTLICIECSGVHRKMGSHISKVRSLDLDQWPCDYMLIMQQIGNQKANAVWEGRLPSGNKIGPSATTQERECFINNKYLKKMYLSPISSSPLSNHLLTTIKNADFDSFIRILPHCSKFDFDKNLDGKNVTHYAACMDSPEFLLLLAWYQADCTLRDVSGLSVIDYVKTNSYLDEYVLSEVMSSIKLDNNVNNNIPSSSSGCVSPATSLDANHANIPRSIHEDLSDSVIASSSTPSRTFLNDVPHSVL